MDGKNTQFSSDNQPVRRGRIPGVPNSATRLARFLKLTQEGENPVSGKIEKFSVLELMDLQQIRAALDGDLKAYTEILDRIEGKVTTQVEHSGADGGAIQVEQTVINIKYRPRDAQPNESGGRKQPKGSRRQG